MKKLKFKNLDEIDTSDYINVDDHLPTEDGVYDVIFQCGSMSISYKPMQAKFRVNRGTFTRWDWDHVIMWKEK